MPGIHFWNRAWLDGAAEHYREDVCWGDLEEPDGICPQCGVELTEDEDVLCTSCREKLDSEPFDQPDIAPDDHLDSDYDERNGDIEAF